MMHFIRSFGSVVLLALFIHGVPSCSHAALNAFDRQEFTFENALADKNPGFESGVTQWTASGGTFVSNSGTQIVPNSKQYATWDSNSASQTLQTAAVTVPKTGNCEFSIWIAVPSGTATHTITVTDGSNDLVTAQTITNNTNALKHIVNFPCPASGTVRGKLTSVNSNEPSISLDNGRLGSATNLSTTQINTEAISFTPTGSWAGTTTYSGKTRRVGDFQYFQVRVVPGSAPTGAALTVTISSVCTIDTNKLASGTAEAVLPEADGSMLDNGSYFGIVKPMYSSTTAVQLRASTSSTNTTLGQILTTSPITWTTGDTIDASFAVPCVGFAASNAIMPDAQGWFASGEISGSGNVSLGVVDVTSYSELTSSALTLTPDNGSAAVGIMCSGTNPAATPSTSATTCAAGNESVGAAVNIPRSGRYEACFDFTHNVQIDSTEVVYSAFNVIQTPTNAQTLTQEGGPRLLSGSAAPTLSGGTLSPAFPIRACGQLNLSSGSVGIRLMYEQAVANNPNNSIIYTDQSSGFGQRSVRFSIRPVTGQTQAILANSVSSSVANGTRVESASYAGGAGSCGTLTQVGDWISSCSRSGTGWYSVTIKTGIFSAAPICIPVAGASSTTVGAHASLIAISATNLQVLVTNESGTEVDNYFGFTCHGNR